MNKFNQGDIVVCIDDIVTKGDKLRYRKAYTVDLATQGRSAIRVYDETGNFNWYNSDLFVKVDELIDKAEKFDELTTIVRRYLDGDLTRDTSEDL